MSLNKKDAFITYRNTFQKLVNLKRVLSQNHIYC
ncbi:Protein of unknown function [Lactobacillus delbrueckii subsp. lactis]|nr:Protein of unknown function [Lactobacillus delbrueckii subsp. lactis]